MRRGCLELGWNNDNSDVTREFPCGKRMRQPQKSNTAARVCQTHEKYIHLIWKKGAATTCGKHRHGMAALGGKIHRRVDISELIKAFANMKSRLFEILWLYYQVCFVQSAGLPIKDLSQRHQDYPYYGAGLHVASSCIIGFQSYQAGLVFIEKYILHTQ